MQFCTTIIERRRSCGPDGSLWIECLTEAYQPQWLEATSSDFGGWKFVPSQYQWIELEHASDTTHKSLMVFRDPVLSARKPYLVSHRADAAIEVAGVLSGDCLKRFGEAMTKTLAVCCAPPLSQVVDMLQDTNCCIMHGIIALSRHDHSPMFDWWGVVGITSPSAGLATNAWGVLPLSEWNPSMGMSHLPLWQLSLLLETAAATQNEPLERLLPWTAMSTTGIEWCELSLDRPCAEQPPRLTPNSPTSSMKASSGTQQTMATAVLPLPSNRREESKADEAVAEPAELEGGNHASVLSSDNFVHSSVIDVETEDTSAVLQSVTNDVPRSADRRRRSKIPYSGGVAWSDPSHSRLTRFNSEVDAKKGSDAAAALSRTHTNC